MPKEKKRLDVIECIEKITCVLIDQNPMNFSLAWLYQRSKIEDRKMFLSAIEAMSEYGIIRKSEEKKKWRYVYFSPPESS